jgi:hypothetical protein
MYEDRVLAFIDILGFSHSVSKTMENGVENPNETTKISNLLKNVDFHLNFDKEHFDGTPYNSKIVNQFSDTIIISYSMTQEAGIFNIVTDISFLSASALQSGFLLRGAIVCDKIYHTEERIFGPALIKAYEMEKHLAIYPRIILDDNIIDIAKSYPISHHDPETEIKFIEHFILKDFDGLNYINYFNAIESEEGFEVMPEYFNCLRKIINEMEAINNTSVKSKYLWIKKKYNDVIESYKNNYNNDRAKETCPDLYEYYKNITLL